MERLKWAQLGERLKMGGAQMGRMVSGKVKEMLQAPTPESKMVDEATLETMEEPNWGMNLRICGMINSDQFNGSEVVKAIKRKINHKSPVVQTLSLDLLEACAMNCDKVFSEIASEKVLDEMIRLIDNPQAQHQTRSRAFQLIRAWGESEDLAYLPVFRQTYMVSFLLFFCWHVVLIASGIYIIYSHNGITCLLLLSFYSLLCCLFHYLFLTLA